MSDVTSNEDKPQTNTIQTNQWQRFKVTLANFNIFHSVESLNDEWKATTERISTRVFFFFLIVTIIIIFTYTVLATDVIEETISHPSQTTYEHLLTLYPNSLQCPCSQTSIVYSSFISIDPTFHPVCQSDFVSRDWIEFLFDYNQSYYMNYDFRSTGCSQFQLLAALCHLANASFDLAQANIIDAATLISVQLISPSFLLAQANALIEQFRSVSPNSFVRIVNLIRGLTAGNKLVPILPTLVMYKIFPNFAILPSPDEILSDNGIYVTTNGSACYCNKQVTCSSPSGFYKDEILSVGIWDVFPLVYENTAKIPGFFTGCYALESLLQSTLECFFNQTCVNFIQMNVKSFSKVNFTAIDINSMTLFTSTWTIEKIIEQLMIDRWQSFVSYEKYFDQCHALSCTFLRVQRHNSLYIITTLIGFTGGLVAALRLLVPSIVSFIRRWMNRKQHDQSSNVARKSLVQRLVVAGTWMKMQLFTLNIFANPQIIENKQTQHRQQIATRLYFIILGVVLSILIFYSLFSFHLQTVTVRWPSAEVFQRLQILYPLTLKCPCTQISIPYNTFMSINPVYHPICSSQFLSQEWIESLYGGYQAAYRVFFEANDFHLTGSTQMSLIRTLCEMVSTTVNDSWNVFKKQQYISSLVRTRDLFDDEVISKLEEFKLDTANSFKSSLDLISMFVQGNQLLIYDSVSMKLTLSYAMGTRLVNIELQPWMYSNKTQCLCALSTMCYSQLAYYRYHMYSPNISDIVTYMFSTFYLGCIPVDSLLQSTLSCFFDQTCLNEINYNMFYMPWSNYNNSFLTLSSNVYKLNASNTRFGLSSTIRDIVYQLMIEQWQQSINFNQYYSTCQPSVCTYTYQQRFDYLNIVTTILALFGGLSTILCLILPLAVKTIRRHRLNLPILLRQHLNLAYQKVKQSIVTWNLFPNTRTHTDEMTKHRQQITTRFYVLLLLSTLFVLTLCRSFSYELINRSINNPSIDEIEYLKKQYPTLDCPCTTISIPYSKFVIIKSRQHPICLSDFISYQWQEKLYQNDTVNSCAAHDFRKSGFAQFQLLSLLCQSTNITLYDSLKIFQTSSLITYKTLSSASFNSTVNVAVEQFRSTISRQFSLTLEFIRYIMHGNGIHSALQTTWKYVVFNVSYFPPLYSYPISYGDNCSCGTSPLCSQPAAIFLNTNEYLVIPGMRVGCYPLESLLQSTLECFYQQTCIDLIATNINPSYSLNLTALDSNDKTVNSTITTLLGDLFIAEWETSMDYNAYFASCKPVSCSYSYVHRLDFLYVFTTLLSLYGGIVVVLRAFVPVSVKAIFKCQHYLNYRQRVAQTPSSPNESRRQTDVSVIE